MGGTDMFCFTSGPSGVQRTNDINTAIRVNDDGAIVEQLKEIAHRIYYTYAHTHLMNGLSRDFDIIHVTPWWQPVVIVVNVVIWLGVAAFVVLFAVNEYGKKNKVKEVASNV